MIYKDILKGFVLFCLKVLLCGSWNMGGPLRKNDLKDVKTNYLLIRVWRKERKAVEHFLVRVGQLFMFTWSL